MSASGEDECPPKGELLPNFGEFSGESQLPRTTLPFRVPRRILGVGRVSGHRNAPYVNSKFAVHCLRDFKTCIPVEDDGYSESYLYMPAPFAYASELPTMQANFPLPVCRLSRVFLLPGIAWTLTMGWLSLAAAQNLTVEQTSSDLIVRDGPRTVLGYKIVAPPAPQGVDPVYERSGCLHPVNTPSGRTVTQLYPPDHPHQHGIFSAWVNTTYQGKPIDFWNLAGGTGRVRHQRVVSTFQDADAAGFQVDMLHTATQAEVDVLRERWSICVRRLTDKAYSIDLESTQSALTEEPLTVNEYHYGGFAVRGPTSWLTAQDGWARKHPQEPHEASRMLNNLGSGREQGNHEHAKWVAMTGQIDGAPVTIVVLSHASNFRAPQAARLHPTKPYFCFAPCVDGSFIIDREHPYQARYRYLVMDATPDSEWLDQQWASWNSQ